MSQPSAEVSRHLAARGAKHILIACSGGADSLALAWLAAQRAPQHHIRVSAAVVDHGLQPNSSDIAAAASERCVAFGIADVNVLTVAVTHVGEGLEAAARHARRSALLAHAEAIEAQEVWLAHTLEDQAETVLIGLTHGSGARSLAGMSVIDGVWVRPLLHCRRADVHAVLPDEVEPWQDPHNLDPRFLRARVRHEVLPVITEVLGDRAIVGLARTAELLARDNDVLDQSAHEALRSISVASQDGVELTITGCADLAPAILARVLRAAALLAGVPPRDLTMSHLDTLMRLVRDPAMNGPVALPGRVGAHRRHGRLALLPELSWPSSNAAEDDTNTDALSNTGSNT